MNKNFYFDGRQIKNYLVGFASLFAEIPYKDRAGKLKTVPIHYGSPSDVISHLENNVDNAATTNVNRLKDISVPMFSFRMTGIERNPDKRRAPHDTMTVDLRPLGYNFGYVTMKPAPYRFTMELVCWASSDYQAFEITEQIIPYFNSPQQVTIEPLPRSPVSATEIFLDSIEIDTEPESQKYSAMITMTFSLTGYLLTQPRVWSTNLQFEFTMLDEKNGNVSIGDTDYSVGHTIRDLNVSEPVLPNEDRLNSLTSFIKNTPTLLAEYGTKLDWFIILKENNRVDDNFDILDSTQLTVDYKGVPKTFLPETMQYVLDEMFEVSYIFENEKLQTLLAIYSLEANLKILDELITDDTETVNVYLTLLDRNLATKAFNSAGGGKLLNSDKLALFGTPRIDTDDALARLRNYLAGLQSMKVNKSRLEIRCGDICGEAVFSYENVVPYDNLPLDIQGLISASYLNDDASLPKLDFNTHLDTFKNVIITTNPNITGKMVLETINGITITDFSTVDGIMTISSDNVVKSEAFGIILVVSGYKTTVYGLVIKDVGQIDINNFDFRIFDMVDLYNIGLNKSGNIVEFELDSEIYKLFDCRTFLDEKFTIMDEYVMSTMLYTLMQEKSAGTDRLLKIVEKTYKLGYDSIVERANKLLHFVHKALDCVDITQSGGMPINDMEFDNGQQTVSPDLAQIVAVDNNGKPIYDINKDGFITKEDLDILGSVVDNPDDYNYELVYGVWHKRSDPENVTPERLNRIRQSLKTILYMMEKDNHIEIVDYLTLLKKDLVTNTYDLYPEAAYSVKWDEIRSFGYDIGELDDKLLFLRLFIEALRIILVEEVRFLIYSVPEMTELSKKLLLSKSGVDLDTIVVGKYAELHLKPFTEPLKLDEEFKIRGLLDKPLGSYLEYVYDYNILIRDIHKTTLFKDSLDAETVWLDEQLPTLRQKIEIKYKY